MTPFAKKVRRETQSARSDLPDVNKLEAGKRIQGQEIKVQTRKQKTKDIDSCNITERHEQRGQRLNV